MNIAKTLLSKHAFLKGLDSTHVDVLAQCASEADFLADEYLFHANQPADRFFLVFEGSVALKVFVPQLGSVPIQTVSDGDALRWSWLFPPYKWHFDARALETVRAISMDAAVLRRSFEQDSALGYQMLKRLSEIIAHRLQATRLQLLDLYEVRT